MTADVNFDIIKTLVNSKGKLQTSTLIMLYLYYNDNIDALLQSYNVFRLSVQITLYM